MNKNILSLIILICFINITKAEEENTFLYLEVSEIKSIKKSSKKKYQKHYLFIARINKLNEINTENKKHELLPKGSLVEILAKKNICYDEVIAAFSMNKKISFIIKNIRKSFFKLTPNKEQYQAFIKIDPIVNKEQTNAECSLTKI